MALTARSTGVNDSQGQLSEPQVCSLPCSCPSPQLHLADNSFSVDLPTSCHVPFSRQWDLNRGAAGGEMWQMQFPSLQPMQ